jgi:hypothetical protein
MSFLKLNTGADETTVSIEDPESLVHLELVINELIVPALRAAGYADTSIAKYVNSPALPGAAS